MKGQNLTFVYTPDHNVISKPHWYVLLSTLYNTNIHSEWFTLINLDQSVAIIASIIGNISST